MVFSNYEPAEVDSTWTTKEKAEERAEQLNENYDWSPWEAKCWEVGE